NPEKTCEFLGRELGLPDVAAMVATATRPSRSTKRSSVGSTKDAIKRRDPETLVGRWRKEASAEQIATTQRLLDQFKVTLYSTEDALPNLEGIACKFVDHT
ncbi:MAG TPA: hypothetical protein VK934_01210, partial [Fimbriimonas sp.]|nr:hypothetical protein [Fimbriimonas sp.]